MPKVSILDYTGAGLQVGVNNGEYAARLLAFSKNTRLAMTPEGLDAWMKKPWIEIEPELAYMAGTIPSSWELVHVTFSIEKLSRATAQQVTRTRNASYCMQSQRVNNMSEVTYDIPPTASPYFTRHMDEQITNYSDEIIWGASLEDARDLLPMGVHCNLIASYNLRALVELVQKRESLRVQGPYVDIVSQMKAETLRVWPWSKHFFEPKHERAIRMIEEVAMSPNLEGEGVVWKDLRAQLAKAADLLKGEQ